MKQAIFALAILTLTFSHSNSAHTTKGGMIKNKTFNSEKNAMNKSVLSVGLKNMLCASGAYHRKISCPGPLSKGQRGGGFTAKIPHLRLNIILHRMKNTIVSGTGIASLGAFEEPWWDVKIESAAADSSIPLFNAPAVGLPVPPPGETWSVPHANVIYQGIIRNGCQGSPKATFDLAMQSRIFRVSSGQAFGEVSMDDNLTGPGDYGFKYTIRATDEFGNVSDFKFVGHADAFCTGKSSL